MKKLFFLMIILVSSVLMESCGSSSRDIEKLIENHEYNEAREVIKDNYYDGGGHRQFRSYELYLVDKAQLEEVFADGEYKEAKELAHELKSPFAFQDVFAYNLKQILIKGNYGYIFDVFGDWEIYCEYNESLQNLEKNEESLMREEPRKDDYIKTEAHQMCYDTNGEYNAEIRRYNALVDNVLDAAIEEKDVDNITECLKFYLPYAVIDSKTKTQEYNEYAKAYDYLYKFKKENSAKEAALKKIAAAGIEI